MQFSFYRSPMAVMVKRWYRSRRNHIVIGIVALLFILYYMNLSDSLAREQDLDITRRNSVIEYIEERLQEALKIDKGTGCEIPKLDPFAKEVTQFDKELPKVVCTGRNWVKCHLSECRVTPEILESTRNIVCTYKDILYETDYKYTIGPPTDVAGSNVYILNKSDHVKVKCTGTHTNSSLNSTVILPSKWVGNCVGFRSSIKPKESPIGREESLNVLILGFDSTARNGFIRRMPKSYEVLTKELHATILNRYNILGDGTPAALFPILTGKNELELPDVRKKMKNNGSMDSMPFIFHKLRDDGYRTAYFEDMPWIGTFQYRFNGFRRQPADHYLRSFYLEDAKINKKYCVGDTPRYRLMLNLTDQFFQLPGKRFCFTFIADITHDDFNMISTADDDVAAFLRSFHKERGEDTLLMVMGDHGPRYANVRDTLQGKLEERLPLMAVVLPRALTRDRPSAAAALASNAEVLTTPHDVHATVLDALGLRSLWNLQRVAGADRPRGLTLLEPIDPSRSCSEAGIEAHWCACVSWRSVERAAPLHARAAAALREHIDRLTEPVRELCVPRKLTSVSWVMRQEPNAKMLSFVAAKDPDGYVGKFGKALRPAKENYQVKIVVGPGTGIFEASLTYLVKEDKFIIDSRDISRTNAYNDEPHCVSATHPHLNMFCYCADRL